MSRDEGKTSVSVAPPAKPTSERKEPVLSRPVGRKSADMKDELSAFEKNCVGKAVAEHTKKEFDKKHRVLLGNCIVGRNFDDS